MHTFLIAEAAATHDGDLTKARQLVVQAKDIGADAVKFQFCSNPQRLAQRRNASEYLPSYQLLNFPLGWHHQLSRMAWDLGLEYMCTVYLPEDIPIVALYVSRFKVASFEAGDAEFVGAHRGYKKLIIVSKGMGGAGWGLETELDLVFQDIAYLYCVSAYPTPIEQINLGRIKDFYDGLSDHTTHPLTGALAVAAGASIIEFHMRLFDTSPDNADYLVSRDPTQAKLYVENIRLAEVLMGDGESKVQECEKPMLRYRVRP